MGQEDSMCMAVCSSSLQLQFAEGTKPHLCIVERISPTPVRRRFSLIQEDLCRVIPGGEGPGDKINLWRREIIFCHFVFLFRPESAVVALVINMHELMSIYVTFNMSFYKVYVFLFLNLSIEIHEIEKSVVRNSFRMSNYLVIIVNKMFCCFRIQTEHSATVNEKETCYAAVCLERDEAKNKFTQLNNETTDLKQKNEALIQEVDSMR